MRADRDFSVTAPGETRDLAFDFKNDVFPLDPTEVLVSAVFSLEVDATAGGATPDSNPSSRLSGSASIADNDDGDTDLAAVQRVTNLVDGNTYIVRCLATTTRLQILEMFAKMPCHVAT